MKTDLFKPMWKILILFLFTIWMLSPIFGLSQVPDSNRYWYLGLTDPDANFYQIRQKGWDYFNSHPEFDTLKGTGFKDLIRWEQFWQDRVYEYENPEAGSFDIAYNAMKDYLDNKDQYFQEPYKENQSWHFFGPDNLTTQAIGFVSCIDFIKAETNIDTIYAGTNASGLFKTVDGGLHWNCVTDTIGLPGLGVQDVVIDPNNNSVVYIATGITTYGRGYGKGIYKSANGGISWQNIFSISNPERRVVHKLLIDPENPLRIFGLINDKVFRTTDGGQNWNEIFNQLTQPPLGKVQKNLLDIEYKPGTNDTIYISSNGLWYNVDSIPYYYTSEIWRCPNATAQENITWQRIDDPSWPFNERIELAETEAGPEKLFACFSFNQGTGDTFALYKSNNYGSNWGIHTKRATYHNVYGSKFGGVNTHRMELIVSPNDTDVVYVGGFYVAKVTNNGQTIQSNDCNGMDCNGFHVDVRELVIASGSSPGSGGINDILFAGNDGGISISENGTVNWKNINGSGLRITQFYGLAIGIDNPEYISSGGQDNGWFIHQPTLGQWKRFGGDYYESIINYQTPDISYCNSIPNPSNAKISFTLNGGESIESINLPKEKFRIDFPIVIDPLNPYIFYTGLHDVYKYTKIENNHEMDTLSHFSATDTVSEGETLSSIAVWEKDPNIIYAAYGSPTWNPSCQKKKLFKTIDGGNRWEDITCELGLLQYLGITDLLIDPDDHNKVWLTIGGFSSPGTKKVIYTEDSFNNITDISEALPNLPVNSIKMLSKANHELIIANDMGVFYRNDDMNQWRIYVKGTPVAIFSDIESNRKHNLIYASTFGRGIWYTEGTFPCPEVSYGDTIFIDSDTVWDTEVRLHHHLKIENGATLNINGTVYIGAENKIMVDRGGKLILDGCLLTNSCNGEYWQGIEVWGNVEKSQLENGTRGTVELINGATVENAMVAIATIKSDSTFHGTDWSGGIIKATDSFFKNNQTHIKFYRYVNFYPWDSIYKNEIANISYFQNCDFTLNPNEVEEQTFGLKLANVNGIKFSQCRFRFMKEVDPLLPDYDKSFVYLQNASDIEFRGCEFINESYYVDHSFFIQKRGIGIFSYNSSFSVHSALSMSTQINSAFITLTYGIKALSISSDHQYTVDSCIFHRTARGIYDGATRHQTITSNAFYLPDNGPNSQFMSYGIYLDNCSQYHVEDNNFYPKNENMAANSIGILVNNSGAEYNMIYRNRFTKLGYGIIAQYDNRGDDDIIGSGLKIKCNEFNNIYNNISVTGELGLTHEGISKYQGFTGSDDAPAGNLFSHYNSIYFPYSDYYNSQRSIIYFHHTPTPALNLVPWYYSTLSVTNENTGEYYSDESCPPNLDNRSRQMLESLIVVESNAIDTMSAILDAWIDGGSTSSLQEEIDFSAPEEGLELRNDLVANSPYLSDTVMINAIEQEDVLTDALIRDVLVANPQSAKSVDIMTELDQRTITLPDYMIEEIEQGIFSVSQKELLEAEYAYHHQERTLVRNELIRSFINDTAVSARDSLIDLFDNETDLRLKYDLAFKYLSNGDSVNTYDVLSAIPMDFSLNSSQQVQHEEFLDYFNLFVENQLDGIKMFEPDSSQLAVLYLIENNSHSILGIYAKNILQMYDSLMYFEPIVLPDTSTKSAKAPKIHQDEKNNGVSALSVYPNPAEKFVLVDYKTSLNAVSSSFKLIDLNGTVLEIIPLYSQENKFVLGTAHLKSCLYFCTLVEDNLTTKTVKLIVK